MRDRRKLKRLPRDYRDGQASPTLPKHRPGVAPLVRVGHDHAANPSAGRLLVTMLKCFECGAKALP